MGPPIYNLPFILTWNAWKGSSSKNLELVFKLSWKTLQKNEMWVSGTCRHHGICSVHFYEVLMIIHLCFPVFSFQVCAREHHHLGRVCWGRGSEPLLCTGPAAWWNNQLAGHSRHQSYKDGRGRVRSLPPYWSLTPLEQQQQWWRQRQQ